jgi:hypothetical protein
MVVYSHQLWIEHVVVHLYTASTAISLISELRNPDFIPSGRCVMRCKVSMYCCLRTCTPIVIDSRGEASYPIELLVDRNNMTSNHI